MIRPTVTLDTAALQRRLNERGRARAYAIALRAAGEMEEEVVRIVRAEFVNDRAPNRRKANTTKLVNSFKGEVIGSGSRVTARLTTKPGVNAKKIAALEYGYSEFKMIPGAKGFAFPDRAQGGATAYRNAYGPNDYWTGKPVTHPAYTGKHMMRRARQTVLARIRAGR